MSKEPVIWRTIQFFISPDGVCEVSVNTSEPEKMRCTCSLFKKFGKIVPCKHVRYMYEELVVKKGSVRIEIPEDLDNSSIEEMLADPELFRDHLLHYGKPNVL